MRGNTDEPTVEVNDHIHQSGEPTEPLSPAKTFWYSLANLGYGAYYALNNAVLPLFLERFTSDNRLIGLMGSSHSIEGAVIQPIVGSISDRMRTPMGRRRPFILMFVPLAALFLLLTPALAALPDSARLTAIVLSIILFTVLFAIAWDPYQALMPDITPTEQRGRITAVMTLFGLIGQAGLMLLPIPVPAKFGLTAVLMLVTTGLMCWSIREPSLPAPDEKARTSHLHDLKVAVQGLRTLRQAKKALLTLFLSGLGIGAVLPFLTRFVKIITGANDHQAQLMFLVLMLASAVCVIPFGWLTDKIGPKRVLLVGLGCIGVAALNGLWVQTLPQVTVILTLAGIGNAAQSAARYPLLTELVPSEEVGFYTGLQSTALSIASPLTAVITGALINQGGYRYIFLVCAIGVFASLAPLIATSLQAAAHEIGLRREETA